MLSRSQFYAEWFKRAFKGRISLAQLVSGLASVAFGAIAYFWQPKGVDVSFVVAMIFLFVFLAVVAIGMLRAPFGIYLDAAIKRRGAPAQTPTNNTMGTLCYDQAHDHRPRHLPIRKRRHHSMAMAPRRMPFKWLT